MSLFSIGFLLFLAVLTAVYFLIPARFQWICLLIFSYAFYLLAGSWRTVGFLIASTVSVFLGARQIGRCQDRFDQSKKDIPREELKEARRAVRRRKVVWLIIILVINLVMLGTMKYGAFVIRSVNVFAAAAGRQPFTVPHLLLPLGISFYTFQAIGYLIDVYRGKARAETDLFRFALFVSYFPQIIQGPISRYGQLAHQLYEEHVFDQRRVKFGLQRILWGLFKKLVIADRVAVIVNEVFGNFAEKEYAGLVVFIGVFLYGIQIYTDFSGGIDIVLGVSQILGIEQVENFRQPYMARSVSEYWQRWHITLGAWMREYVFYPLALSKPFTKWGRAMRKTFGTRMGKVIPTSVASFIVFVLVGIWHGASWNFIAYGLYQAFFVSTGTLFSGGYARMKAALRVKETSISWILFQMIRTTVIVTFGRYLSRAAGFREAFAMWKATFSRFDPWVLFDGTLYKLGLSMKNVHLMIILIVLLLVVDILHEKGVHIREQIEKTDVVFRWTLYFAGIFGIIVLGMYGPGYQAANFIYQGF